MSPSPLEFQARCVLDRSTDTERVESRRFHWNEYRHGRRIGTRLCLEALYRWGTNRTLRARGRMSADLRRCGIGVRSRPAIDCQDVEWRYEVNAASTVVVTRAERPNTVETIVASDAERPFRSAAHTLR